MNPWAIALFIMALIVLALSRGVPRAWLWIGVGSASFVASSAFWEFGTMQMRDLHPVFTFACDALVCLAIHVGAKEKWELGVFVAFLMSVFASLLRLGGFIQDGTLYASLLELCNFGALLLIGGTGLLDMIGKHEDSYFHPVHRRLHSARNTL